jgi:hypothetical protein
MDTAIPEPVPDEGIAIDEEVAVETVETIEDPTPVDPFEGGSEVEGDATPDAELPPPGPWSLLCAMGCEGDTDCGEGNRCLSFTGSSTTFCAVACEGGKCPQGFGCSTSNGSVCVPYQGDCEVATLGIACNGTDLAGICKGRFDACTSTDARPGYCTADCVADAECIGAYRDCRAWAGGAKLCRGLWEAGPEGCGLGMPSGGPGTEGGACLDAAQCLAGRDCVDAPADQGVMDFCAAPCAIQEHCDAGACSATAGGGETHCIADACECLVPSETMYDQALAAVGLTRCTAVFPRAFAAIWPHSMGHDDWRLSRFHELHDDPPAAIQGIGADVPPFAAETGTERVRLAIERAAVLLDRPVPPVTAPWPPSASLADAIVAFATAAGGAPDATLIAQALATVPITAQAGLIGVVDAMTDVVEARAAVSATIADKAVEGLLFSTVAAMLFPGGFGPSLKSPWMHDALAWKVDVALLYEAAARLAKTVGSVPVGGFDPPLAFAVRIPTPAGAILLRGEDDDVYDPSDPDAAGPIALLVDFGGNDTYRVQAGANASLDNPVSILIDTGGDDTYGYVEKEPAPDPLLLPSDAAGRYKPAAGPDQDNGPFSLSYAGRQGAGIYGVGMVFDLGTGKDHYRSLRMSQGFGMLGVGALYDQGGDDVYECEAGCQAAAMFGIGVLVDEGGDDQYASYADSQGFGFARGMGLLFDALGTDAYVARLGDPALGGYPLYYNPQNPGKSNSSMSQGFGFGRRADMSDQVYMSGGIGMLYDAEGSDSYTADIFGQGAGYWFGTGVLVDGGGDDTYRGRWYVQGSAAHFAVGMLLDKAGNDVHNPDLPTLNASLGCGHDFSLGVLVDWSGNDEYHSPSLSMGAGNDNGIGIFLDIVGDDHYEATANNTLGWASNSDFGADSARNDFICVGVFLDAGGNDTYVRPDLPGAAIGNGMSWTMSVSDPAPAANEYGTAMDADGVEPGFDTYW